MKGCCALGGKKIKTRLENGERFYSRSQWDHIKQSAARSPLEPVEINGRTYFSLQLAYRHYPSLGRIYRRLCRWLQEKDKSCPFLVGDRSLDGEKFPFRGTCGFRLLWVVCREDLEEIAANYKAGRVLDILHGAGLSYGELGRMGYGKQLLVRLHRKGAVELGGEKLDTWKEYRITSDGDVRKVRVFDPAYLKRLQAACLSPPSNDRHGLTDREALEKYPHYLHDGDLDVWRRLAKDGMSCQWLDRPLDAWKVPGKRTNEWRTSAKDIAEIVERMKAAAEGRWIDPETGKSYLTLSAFRALTGMPEQSIAQYREGPKCLNHTALGAPIAWKQVPMPSRRNNHTTNYVYLEKHGQMIAEWKRSGRPRKLAQAEKTTTSEQPASGEAPPSVEDETPQPSRGRGRPKGRTTERIKREKEMLAAWDRGEYCTNKARAGRAHGFHRQDATNLINDHERKKCK
jgi:hypothetical protein